MKKYDAIVIGAGHNGLANAAYLAKAGLDVVVLEKNDYIGGAAVSRELHEGWVYSNASYVCSMLRQAIHRDLDLTRHGLMLVPYLATVNFGDDGTTLIDYANEEAAYLELKRHSPHDADSMHRFQSDLGRYAQFIRKTLLRTPPDPTSFRPRDIRELLFLGKQFWSLGEREMYEYVRFFTMSAAEFLEDYFENDLIKAAMASPGIIGTALGVCSPGSAYILLHHVMGDVDGNMGAWGFARGGMGAVSRAMHDCFTDHGGETVAGSPVHRILVRNGRVTGVALENGDEHQADVVVSNMTLPRTFLECMDAKDLDPGFLKKVRNFKIRGSSGKLNIALDGLPDFPALRGNPELMHADMHLIDSIERLERAYDDWKNGIWSQDPYIDMLIPSLTDPTMTPPGKHFMSVFVQYVPPKVNGQDWTDDQVQAFGQTVVNQIDEYAPGFKDLILHMEVRTPRELEDEVGLTEGNIFQGELTMDQLLFNRPIPGYHQYRGPVRGLWMCGSSNHPGGGVMSAPGANAAREILADLRRPNTVPEGWQDD